MKCFRCQKNKDISEFKSHKLGWTNPACKLCNKAISRLLSDNDNKPNKHYLGMDVSLRGDYNKSIEGSFDWYRVK